MFHFAEQFSDSIEIGPIDSSILVNMFKIGVNTSDLCDEKQKNDLRIAALTFLTKWLKKCMPFNPTDKQKLCTILIEQEVLLSRGEDVVVAGIQFLAAFISEHFMSFYDHLIKIGLRAQLDVVSDRFKSDGVLNVLEDFYEKLNRT